MRMLRCLIGAFARLPVANRAGSHVDHRARPPPHWRRSTEHERQGRLQGTTMRNAGRLAAAIEVMADFQARRVPMKTAIKDWGRANRYAGAKDRAWISGICLEALRRRASYEAVMSGGGARTLILAAMRWSYHVNLEDLNEMAGEAPHGPGTLNAAELDALARAAPPTIVEAPDWTWPLFERAFDDAWRDEVAALTARADIDLRINTLKASPEKAMGALKTVKAVADPFLVNAARINAPATSEKGPPVNVIPAFNKGWVEVQDRCSQIAAAAAGDIAGLQVLDFCAGGGGKTLALAAMMENTGQLYAYDRDPRRLAPLFHRARRAGVRNLQIRSPAGGESLDDFAGKMDVVFVDAPCTGAGTWRRRPDTKWRLTPAQLQRRIEEQDEVLKEAALSVKPGGSLIYATCSVFAEECEDRITQFLEGVPISRSSRQVRDWRRRNS